MKFDWAKLDKAFYGTPERRKVAVPLTALAAILGWSLIGYIVHGLWAFVVLVLVVLAAWSLVTGRVEFHLRRKEVRKPFGIRPFPTDQTQYIPRTEESP